MRSGEERWEAEMRGWAGGREYKRMKRRWEEGVCVWRRKGGGRGSSGQSTCFLSLSSHFFFFFIHLFCLANRRDTQRGKSRVLKIPPSFLCPSPLLKTCRLHGNNPPSVRPPSPRLHTELLQFGRLECVCVGETQRETERRRVCLLLVPLCVGVCVSVCLCARRRCRRCAAVSSWEGTSPVNISPTRRRRRHEVEDPPRLWSLWITSEPWGAPAGRPAQEL